MGSCARKHISVCLPSRLITKQTNCGHVLLGRECQSTKGNLSQVDIGIAFAAYFLWWSLAVLERLPAQ
jgi:hypothetical protein